MRWKPLGFNKISVWLMRNKVQTLKLSLIKTHNGALCAPPHCFAARFILYTVPASENNDQLRKSAKNLSFGEKNSRTNIKRSSWQSQLGFSYVNYYLVDDILYFCWKCLALFLGLLGLEKLAEGLVDCCDHVASRHRSPVFLIALNIGYYGVGSPKFIWAPCHVMCTAVLIG